MMNDEASCKRQLSSGEFVLGLYVVQVQFSSNLFLLIVAISDSLCRPAHVRYKFCTSFLWRSGTNYLMNSRDLVGGGDQRIRDSVTLVTKYI